MKSLSRILEVLLVVFAIGFMVFVLLGYQDPSPKPHTIAMAIIAVGIIVAGLSVRYSRTVDQFRADVAKDHEQFRADVAKDHEEEIKYRQLIHDGNEVELRRIHRDMLNKEIGRNLDSKMAASAREVVIQAVVPQILAIAQRQPDTPNGDQAARWLYLVNCLGLWTPTNGDSRIVAKGQALAKLNPTETERMIEKFRVDRVAELKASSDAKSEKPLVADELGDLGKVPSMAKTIAQATGEAFRNTQKV
jgi:hypothetical protein